MSSTNEFDFSHMCVKCKKMIEYKYHMNCGVNNTECGCHKKSIWGTEKETFSQFTPEMLKSIIRDTTEADIKSDKELSKNG